MTTSKKTTADKKIDKAVDEAIPTAPTAYRVEAGAFQAALNTLAELPYNKVGDLLNQLRASTAILAADEKA